MVDREQIGIRIAALRKKAGLSQTALAERLNTRKWERLYRTLDEPCYLYDTLFDIEEWKEICRQTGYLSTDAREIYGELPASEEEVFPFENEVLQWMGEYLCVSEK